MSDFAIIKSSGKQYKVKIGELVNIDYISKGKKGDTILFETLLVNFDNKTQIGVPILDTKVKGTIVNLELKGEKVHIRKYIAKSRHRRHIGHRQKYTVVKIEDIL